MSIAVLHQLLMIAVANYYNVLAMLAEVLHKYGNVLALMAPGLPEQLASNNGVDITADGFPIYQAVVKRYGNAFRSPMTFGQAIQEALDRTCYAACSDRLVLLRVDQLPGGYVNLTLTIGSW